MYSVGSDPKGSIPKWVVNAANVKAPLAIARIRQLILDKPELLKWAHDTRLKRAAEAKQVQRDDDSRLAASDSERGPAQQDAVQHGATQRRPAAPELKEEIPPSPWGYQGPPNRYDQQLSAARTAVLEAATSGADAGWKPYGRTAGVDVFMRRYPGCTVDACKGILVCAAGSHSLCVQVLV